MNIPSQQSLVLEFLVLPEFMILDQRLLNQPLKPVYVFSGEEFLLLMEAKDQLRDLVKKQGFDERIVFDVSKDFNWQDFVAETQAMSLFSDKKIIELNIPTGKPGTVGAKILGEYCAQPAEDIILLVACGKVDFKGGKPPAWYKKLDEVGTSIRFWQVGRDKLPAWIKQRATQKSLVLAQGAVSLLVDKTDGNLLACAQELDKLELMGFNGEVTEQDMIKSVSDNAHHSIYDCIDTALKGDAELTTKMLYSLKSEQFPEAVVVWALMNELQKLEQLAWLKRTGGLNNGMYMRFQIWKSRQQIVGGALAKHNYAFWAGSIAACAKLERLLKGRQQGANVYAEVLDLLLLIANKPLYKPINRLLARTEQELLVTN